MAKSSVQNKNPKTTQQAALLNEIKLVNNGVIFGCAPGDVIEKFNLFCKSRSSLASAIFELLGRATNLKLKYKLKDRSRTYEMIAKKSKKENKDNLNKAIGKLCAFAESNGNYDVVCAIEELLFSPNIAVASDDYENIGIEIGGTGRTRPNIPATLSSVPSRRNTNAEKRS